MRRHRQAVGALAAALWFPPPSGAQQAQKVWRLEAPGAAAGARARLSFGLPETDDTVIRFSCAPASGVLKVFIPHTSKRMKRGAGAMARLTSGGARWSIGGKILANDESLDESFEGATRFDPARFLALMTDGTLQATVGRGPAQKAPLDGAVEIFRKFSGLCVRS